MRKVILKGLLARKLRLALTAISISLGVAFVTGTFVLGDTMTATFDQLYEGLTEGTDVTVRGESAFTHTSTLGTTKPFDAAVLDRVEAVDGVRAAAGSVTGYALILDKAGEPVQPGGAPTPGASYTTDRGLAGGFALRSGSAPEGPREVVLDAATAGKHGFAPGDPVTILFPDGPREFTVVGIAGFGDADNLAGATIATFDLPTAQQVLGKAGLYDTVAVAGEQGVSPEELRDRIAAALPQGVEAVTSAEVVAESSAAVADALGFFTTGLLGFAAISLLVGALIIWNTFSILVAQRTRKLALLRAVGASRRQVRFSVVAEAFVIGLVSAAPPPRLSPRGGSPRPAAWPWGWGARPGAVRPWPSWAWGSRRRPCRWSPGRSPRRCWSASSSPSSPRCCPPGRRPVSLPWRRCGRSTPRPGPSAVPGSRGARCSPCSAPPGWRPRWSRRVGSASPRSRCC